MRMEVKVVGKVILKMVGKVKMRMVGKMEGKMEGRTQQQTQIPCKAKKRSPTHTLQTQRWT